MGKRKALLVGVTQCHEKSFTLEKLPSVEHDIKGLNLTLSKSEYECLLLKDPSRESLATNIENFFNSCDLDDLVLFYFSGHAIRDIENGILYLTTSVTEYDGSNFRLSSALSSKECLTYMEKCKASRKIVILDSCYSGSFVVGLSANQKGSLSSYNIDKNLENDFGGKGIAILTSCSSTEESIGSFSDESKMSLYTHYLIQALNGEYLNEIDVKDVKNVKDDKLTAHILHSYVSEKVKKHSNGMNPQFFPTREGSNIIIAEIPKLLIFKKKYEAYHQKTNGKLNDLHKKTLKNIADDYKISPDDYQKIEEEFNSRYQLKSEKQRKYFEGFDDTFKDPEQLSNKSAWEDLNDFQESLKLSDADINRPALIKIIQLMLVKSKYIKAFFIINPDDGRTIDIESNNMNLDPTIYYCNRVKVDKEYLGVKFPRLLSGKDNILKDYVVLFFRGKDDIICIYSYPETSLKAIFLCENSDFSDLEKEIEMYRNAMNRYMKKLEYV